MQTAEQYRSGSLTCDRIAALLIILAALGAVYGAVTGAAAAGAAGAETKLVEWWRVTGLLMFAGIFVLLAIGPRKYPGLWELVIFNKLILTVIESNLIGQNAANAQFSAVVDGILIAVILTAYFISQGYRSWKT